MFTCSIRINHKIKTMDIDMDMDMNMNMTTNQNLNPCPRHFWDMLSCWLST